MIEFRVSNVNCVSPFGPRKAGFLWHHSYYITFARRKNIIEVCRRSDLATWKRASQYFLVTGMVSLSPFLLASLAFAIGNLPLDVLDFIKHGEAGISSIGILLWTGVLIVRDLKSPFAHRTTLQLLTLGLLSVAVVIYVVVRVLAAGGHPVNIPVLKLSSVILWLLSFLVGSLVVLVDAVRVKLDPKAPRAEQFDKLEHDFKELSQ